MNHRIAVVFLLGALACKGDETDSDVDTDTGTDSDTEYVPTPEEVCDGLGFGHLEFDTTGPFDGARRHNLVQDLAFARVDGTEWRYSEATLGCDSVIVVPHTILRGRTDPTNVWEDPLNELLDNSPVNVFYVFATLSGAQATVNEHALPMQDRVDTFLASLPEEDAAWWGERLLVSGDPLTSWDGPMLEAAQTFGPGYGYAIDRAQEFRTLGSMADVESYSAAEGEASGWPFMASLHQIGFQPQYYNHEAERQERLDAIDADEIVLFERSLQEQYADIEVTLPDAATMAGYDSIEIDVVMECPNEEGVEQGNCGAWDYLAYLWLRDEADTKWLEAARFITTYHRESRWVVEAPQALPWLAEGGTRTFRYEWAPSWNKQPTIISVRLLLSNQGKGERPVSTVPLYSGGSFNAAYNDGRDPIDVDISADATRVELRAIITGHGSAAGSQCSEFCNHQHEFTVGDSTYFREYPEAQTTTGCQDDSAFGTVPNQSGTWWYGRGGWCPGRLVTPTVWDVTGDVTPGSAVTATYRGKYRNNPVTDSAGGNIKLSSWLVVYE